MTVSILSQFQLMASNEMTLLTDHSKGLVIKDQDAADNYETDESMKAAYGYLDVYYKLDKYPLHERIRLIISELLSVSNPEFAPLESVVAQIYLKYKKDVGLSEMLRISRRVGADGHLSSSGIDQDIFAIRDDFLNNFDDLNVYYRNLKEQFGVPIWKSRNAGDFDILYEPPIADKIVLGNFNATYYECKKYFMAVIFTKALSKDMVKVVDGSYMNYYKAYCRFFICFMTMVKVINSKLKNPLDSSMMDEYVLDNMLFSFGFKDFRDFPVDYKRKILSNINELIQHKGTDRIFVDILRIFDFKDMNIFKYYIVKYSSNNDEKCLCDVEQDVRFLSHDVKIPSLQEAIKRDDYRSHDFNSTTENDPLWDASKLEVAQSKFNYVNSKYFSIEVSFGMMDESASLAYFINMVKNLQSTYSKMVDLSLSASRISAAPVGLSDITVALQILMADFYGFQDDIEFSEAGTQSIFSYNLSDTSELNSLVTSDAEDVANVDTQRFVLRKALSYGNLDKPDLESLYESDVTVHQNMRNKIMSMQSSGAKPSDYAAMKNLYNSKFLASYSLSEYTGFVKYIDYIASRNEALHKYLQNVTTTMTPDEKKVEIMYVLNILVDYCKKLHLRFDNRFSDIVSTYVSRMVMMFKAYTVTLKDFTVKYQADEKLFFTFLEEQRFTSVTELIETLPVNDTAVFACQSKQLSKMILCDRVVMRIT